MTWLANIFASILRHRVVYEMISLLSNTTLITRFLYVVQICHAKDDYRLRAKDQRTQCVLVPR